METERFNEHIVYNHHCPVIRYKLAPYFSVHGAILAKHHRGQWNEEDGMLAQGREAKVTRFLHVSSVHDVKQAEDGNIGLLACFWNNYGKFLTRVHLLLFYVDPTLCNPSWYFGYESDATIGDLERFCANFCSKGGERWRRT